MPFALLHNMLLSLYYYSLLEIKSNSLQEKKSPTESEPAAKAAPPFWPRCREMALRACKAAGAVFAPFSQSALAETPGSLSGFFPWSSRPSTFLEATMCPAFPFTKFHADVVLQRKQPLFYGDVPHLQRNARAPLDCLAVFSQEGDQQVMFGQSKVAEPPAFFWTRVP